MANERKILGLTYACIGNGISEASDDLVPELRVFLMAMPERVSHCLPVMLPFPFWDPERVAFVACRYSEIAETVPTIFLQICCERLFLPSAG